MKTGVERISVSLPKGLLKELDEVIKQVGYGSRSKAIHDAIRSLITEHRWLKEAKGRRVGAVIMIYDHSQRGLASRLIDIQHHFEDVICSTVHVHLDEENCMEIVAVRGEAERIRSLAEELRVLRGVKQLKVTIAE